MQVMVQPFHKTVIKKFPLPVSVTLLLMSCGWRCGFGAAGVDVMTRALRAVTSACNTSTCISASRSDLSALAARWLALWTILWASCRLKHTLCGHLHTVSIINNHVSTMHSYNKLRLHEVKKLLYLV